MAFLKTFSINGKSVKSLFINGKEVHIEEAPSPSEFWGLTFTAEEAGSTIKLHTYAGNPPAMNLVKSTDGVNWSTYNIEDVVTLPAIGDKVMFKAVGSNQAVSKSTSDWRKFEATGKIKASGNLNSLLEENQLSAENLELTGKSNCYINLFNDCTSLTNVSEMTLPSTALANSCYRNLFIECINLSGAAPILPATNINFIDCYSSMFQSTKINQISVAFSKWLASSTSTWVEGVPSTGTFYCPTALGTNDTITRGSFQCPSGWTVINTDAT